MSDRDQSREPTGALRRVLDLEAAISVRLARAHEDAERILTRARAEAAGREESLAEELDEAISALRARLERENGAEIRRIEDAARAEAAALDAVRRAQISRFAETLLERLLGSGRAGKGDDS